MSQKLTPEQSAALNQHPGEPLRIEDPTANRVYVVLDEALAQRAMQALEEQETWGELQESIAQADDGQVMPLSEADVLIRKQAGLPERS